LAAKLEYQKGYNQRDCIKKRKEEQRPANNEAAKAKRLYIKLNHKDLHEDRLSKDRVRHRATSRAYYQDHKEEKKEYQQNCNKKRKKDQEGGADFKTKKRLENALPEPSSKCHPYGPLAKASIVAYYTQKDTLKLPQIDQILGRFPPRPLLHGLYQKYGGDAALCNLRKAIRADEDSRLLDAIAASGLAPAGKRMRAV
jgi:hypothetical protein